MYCCIHEKPEHLCFALSLNERKERWLYRISFVISFHHNHLQIFSHFTRDTVIARVYQKRRSKHGRLTQFSLKLFIIIFVQNYLEQHTNASIWGKSPSFELKSILQLCKIVFESVKKWLNNKPDFLMQGRAWWPSLHYSTKLEPNIWKRHQQLDQHFG